MKCPNCNSEIAENSKFCTRCGTKIEQAPTAAPTSNVSAPVCVKCGAVLKPGAKFCAKCGAAQAAAAPATVSPVGVTQSDKTVTPQNQSQPVPQPQPQPVSQPQPQPVPQPQPQSVSQPKQAAPKTSSVFPIVIIVVVVMLIGLLAGGYVVMDKVLGINPIAMLTGGEDNDTEEGKDDNDKDNKDIDNKDIDNKDEDAKQEEVQGDSQKEDAKGDPALLDELDVQYDAVKALVENGESASALADGLTLLSQYAKVAEDNKLQEEAAEKIENTYALVSEAAIAYGRLIESQAIGSAAYDQVESDYNSVMGVLTALREQGYEIDSSAYEEYYGGIIQRFRDTFIAQINSITEREQWSRDEAWTYAEQAYSVQRDGKTVLFDGTDLDDPLRMRYVYCLAWITTKRCENGVADGSMTQEDAFNTMTAILEETDYNLLVLQAAINYGNAAGKDVSAYKNAYDAITRKIKELQNLSVVVNSGVTSSTSVDIRKFWYFNDLDGENSYKVDINNGTTSETRAWIRENIPYYFK